MWCFNYNYQDATICGYLCLKALHVSSGFSAHNQEHIIMHSASGIVNQRCCRLVSWVRWDCCAVSPTIPGCRNFCCHYLKLSAELCAPDCGRSNRPEHVEPFRNHHHYHISFMELGHLLTRSGLTYPEVSSKVYHDSFCQLGSSVSLSFKENLSGFFPWDLPVVKISPECVTGPQQGKSSGRIAAFSLWTGMFRDGISSNPGATVIPLWLGRHFLVCEKRVYHEKVRMSVGWDRL